MPPARFDSQFVSLHKAEGLPLETPNQLHSSLHSCQDDFAKRFCRTVFCVAALSLIGFNKPTRKNGDHYDVCKCVRRTMIELKLIQELHHPGFSKGKAVNRSNTGH
jgi:hypothetical protein